MPAATTRRRRSSGAVLRSLSPSGALFRSSNTKTFLSAFTFTTTTTSYSARRSSSTTLFNLSSSAEADSDSTVLFREALLQQPRGSEPLKNRTCLCSPTNHPGGSFRCSLHKSNNHQSSPTVSHSHNSNRRLLTCMCSPSNHPVSFRCSLHKNTTLHSSYQRATGNGNNHHHSSSSITVSYNSRSNRRLNMRRLALTNSLVRMGVVQRETAKKALAALVRPSSFNQGCREDFQRRPTRLSVMTKIS